MEFKGLKSVCAVITIQRLVQEAKRNGCDYVYVERCDLLARPIITVLSIRDVNSSLLWVSGSMATSFILSGSPLSSHVQAIFLRLTFF